MAAVKDILYRTKIQDGGAKAGFDAIDKAMSKTSVTVGGQLTPTLQQSANQMTNFGRIMQDAPYGIRGVANNIQFLTEDMKRMSAAGISVTQQMKGMAMSMLTGPGAVLMAVNVLTTALVIFGNQSSKTKGEIKGLSDELKANWSATYKAAEEWRAFKKDIEKMGFDDLKESLRSVK